MKFFVMRLFILALSIVVCISCKKESNNPAPNPNPNPQPASIPQVDNAISGFMTQYNVPGLSLAISKNGKLVYAKSYGKADVTAGTDVTNSSLFRIASVSKPITGIAIMKLVEAGQLNLDQKVFGAGSILGTQYGTQPYGPNITNITVRHLLHHVSGGWPNNATDAMFSNPTLTLDQLISWALDNQPLQHTPGTNFAYSNFGYAVLGKVIAKISGQTYEQYVKTNVLQPAGISNMSIGGSTEAERKNNEVKYYGQGGQNPYGFNLPRMDANGGWIATATDLVKLLVRVDGFSTKADILNAASITTMTTPSSITNYALGWNVNTNNHWWHIGSLPGTISQVVRTSTGYTWAMVANTRATSGSFATDFDGLMWQAVNNNATQWPDVDLF